MVVTATTVKHQVLESELEALLNEAELIHSYQPPYNTLLKDDKSPLYIYITTDQFPRVLQLRKKELSAKNITKGTVIGPFPSSTKVREVLSIVRPIFPWCNQPSSKNNKPCFYRHLQLCPGACVGEISEQEYKENIKQLVLFLKGQRKTVSTLISKMMKDAVETEEFEKAATLRDRLQLIEEVTNRSFRLKPELTTPILQDSTEHGIKQLQSFLNQYLFIPLQHPLTRIEGYDVSNTSGTLASVAMVTFIDGKPSTDNYRLFNIRTLQTPNDFHMMKEALARRQNHSEWGVPDLVVIDGGKGQLRAALSTWVWNTPVISIAKDPDRLIIPRVNWPEIIQSQPRNYDFLKKIEYAVVTLPPQHPSLIIIQHIRDESHRFSKKQHTRRREKNMFL